MKKASIARLIYWGGLEFGNFLKEPSRMRLRLLLFCFLILLIDIFRIAGQVLGFEVPMVLWAISNYGIFIQMGVFVGVLILKVKPDGLRKSKKHPPSLKRISNFADFWGLGLRKRIKASAGEFDVEVKRLHKEKRYRMAKWNVVLAWGYAIWYVLRGPYDLVKGAMVKAFKGL